MITSTEILGGQRRGILHSTTAAICFVLIAGLAAAQSDQRSNDYADDVTLPDIARYDSLPTRFFLRSEFQTSPRDRVLPEEFLKLFLEVLNGEYDNELKSKAIVSLERVAREQLADHEAFLPAVRRHLAETGNLEHRRGCVKVLLAANSDADADTLAKLCTPANLSHLSSAC